MPDFMLITIWALIEKEQTPYRIAVFWCYSSENGVIILVKSLAKITISTSKYEYSLAELVILGHPTSSSSAAKGK